MIAIYTPVHSARLKYVLNYIFKEKFGVNYLLFDDEQQIDQSYKIRINYSKDAKENFLNIFPEGLLEESGIKQREVSLYLADEEAETYILFDNKSDTGFDLFSAVFYCLSRYEEYGENSKDSHGRFNYKSSFMRKKMALQWPLVDFWLKDFKAVLRDKFGWSEDEIVNNSLNILPTIDIDSVFSYKGRGMVRQAAGFAKSIMQGKGDEIIKRLKVVFFRTQDPNDNFAYQFETLARCGMKANYFIQIGAYGPYDKNVSGKNPEFKAIIKKIKSEGHTVGLHPSYQSNGQYEIIKKEKEVLENIIGMPVIHSRQHYLRFSMPDTYRTLIALGIKKEYSMGYSEEFGYRAATSQPFYWYDLERESVTDLEIVPFCAMDVAFKEFLGLNVKETIFYNNEMKDMLRKANGTFSFVFHNESLSNHRGWEGWREVFESWLEK